MATLSRPRAMWSRCVASESPRLVIPGWPCRSIDTLPASRDSASPSWIVGDIRPLRSPRRFLLSYGTAPTTPLPSCGDPARVPQAWSNGTGRRAGNPGRHGSPVAAGRRPPGPAGPRHHDEATQLGQGAHWGHGTGGPVSRSGLVAAAGQGRVLRTEPGRNAALAVGDGERVAAPCDDSVTSTQNSNSLFACRWLRAAATMHDERLTDASAANPFRLPRLHPGMVVRLAPTHALRAIRGLLGWEGHS